MHFNDARAPKDSDRREESSIFITEGLSASGSITKIRDVETQAVFSLRGKPLNTFGLQPAQVVQNEEFNRLLDEIEALEADRIYCRHGLEHLLDVARISYIQVLEDGLDYDKNILYAAALLHDIGRAAEYRDAGSHDEAGAVIAEGILRDCGYAESEIQMIQEAIRGHGEERGSGLAALLHRSDKASRMCFRCKAADTCKWKVKNEGIEK